MQKTRLYVVSFLQFAIFFLSLVTTWYDVLAILLFLVCIISGLDKLGRSILLREIVAVHTCFICLIMPLVAYEIFNSNNELVRIWRKQMHVDKNMYFNFALPAVSGFIFTLCWPIVGKRVKETEDFLTPILSKARGMLISIPKTGLHILILGVVMFWISNLLPVEVQFAFMLFYFASFSGLLYVYYTPNFKYRYIVLSLFGLFVLLNTFSSGMFTIVAYMGLTIFSFFFLGKRVRLWKKTLWLTIGCFFLLTLQLVKPAYRKITWDGNYHGNKALLFIDLAQEQVSDLNWQSVNSFFPVFVRTNQGFNVSLVMRRIPNLQRYDNGNRLMLSFAAALIPRVFWPDKPEAGGRFNMKYYAGVEIKGWSTNVGPLGEAYGSFGRGGGIIFMIFLGWFIRLVYRVIYVLARNVPLLLLWIPVLFYQVTYSAESDTLQIFNSLFKSALFIWILFKIMPSWFGKIRNRRVTTKSHSLIAGAKIN